MLYGLQKNVLTVFTEREPEINESLFFTGVLTKDLLMSCTSSVSVWLNFSLKYEPNGLLFHIWENLFRF